ncbi:hypothetical protein OG21DRAFT_1516219 [Imleria badia]|nr:hypothetical protein OG21DRAFT_1516219 [Imleria badia]
MPTHAPSRNPSLDATSSTRPRPRPRHHPPGDDRNDDDDTPTLALASPFLDACSQCFGPKSPLGFCPNH